MRKFIVNVNGNQYHVEIEEVSSGLTQSIAPAQVAMPVQVQAPAPAQAAPAAVAPVSPVAPTAPTGGESVKSPMPGTILNTVVAVGNVVKRGDVLCILEAMKMENEILSPKDGKVTYVIEKGTAVNAGDILISLE